MSAIGASAVLRPLREASRGLTSRRASYVVPCTMGTSWSRAKSADSSLSAILSPLRRVSSAGVTSTIPTRDFASPLSISRSNGVPRATSFSLNQTETPRDSSRSWRSLAAPCRSSHAWQRKRREGQARTLASRRFRAPARASAPRQACTPRMSLLATSSALRCCRTCRRCSGRPRCSTRSRTGTSTTRSRRHSRGHSGHRMLGSSLRRSLSDGRILVLCI